MKISRKEWYLIICTLVYVEIFGGLLIVNFPKHKVEVITAMIGLLSVVSTGYGAYLGAKIAGDNSAKLMKEQLVMSEFSSNSKEDIQFLEKFHSISEVYKLNTVMTHNNFDEQIMNYIDAKNELNKLNIDETSQIIRYPFKIFMNIYNNKVGDMEWLVKDFDNTISTEYGEGIIKIDKDNYIVVLDGINFPKLINQKYVSKTIQVAYSIYTLKDNDYDHYEFGFININTIDLYNFIISKYESSINKMLDESKEIYKEFSSLEFKSNKDLIKFVMKYYKK